MTGTTGLQGLRVQCVVGVYERERSKPQPLVVDIELDYDIAAAARSDAIGDAVDYDGVAASITELAQRRGFRLLEAMAEETAAMLLQRLPQVRALRMSVRKPEAVPAAECSFVRIERKQP